MSDVPPVLRCEGLGRRYRRQAPALLGVDLELARGEVLGLIGPNGGGKSTLLLLMAGLLAPSTGTVEVEGRPALRLARDGRGRVGLITAEPGLYPLLTGRENLRYFGALHGLAAPEVDRRTGPLTARLGLDGALDRPVSTCSSGMRQKISLARALLMSPAVLLLDEPTANLDPVSARSILALVRQQADQGLAVVMATHDLVLVERFCERSLLLSGRVLEERRFPGPRGLPPVPALFAPYEAALHEAEAGGDP